ncbi:type IX secretion system periplasmic lipoprotein PorW/SprE [Salinimicrobium sp. CAU 1759]
MEKILKATAVLLLLVALTGCSRKKNTFLNRNWHAVTAEYNTLYNGNIALDLGIEALNESYLDNYWQILPVERMEIRDEVMAPGETLNPNFVVAEEKAVKAIQRHSMLIEGSENNPQIDEAYLLLGKARYYDQRFVPALEAFNYILHKYPLSNTINEARIWREKTNMRLEFDALAIKNLKKILESERLQEENRAEASAMLAQAYLNINAPDSALAHIRRAAEITDKKNNEGRYWYITGQLYDVLGKPDSASYAFDQVIELNRKIPRIYLVNAMIRQIEYLNATAGEKAVVLEQLTELADDRENRPYLDKIYFQLAEFHYQQDSIPLAMEYYNRSLRTPSNNTYLQSLDYQTLGNINFDAANFEVAGAYYDSTLTKLSENSREFRLIKRKRDNLDDVIYYENLAEEADSILYVASLTEEQQLKYFEDYTAKLREQATSETQKPAQEQAAQNFFENKRPAMPGVPNPGSSFYFYNPTAVAYGKQEFFRLWGDRELNDNWRTRRMSGGGEDLATSGVNDLIENDPRYNPQTYISRIPTNPAELDSIKGDLNFASYQLGLIYREKFNENELAAERLEFLLQNDPEDRLLLPAKYNLFKIYTDLGVTARAQSLKNDILVAYPDSRYAAIISNPESLLKDENNPTSVYEELYKKYEDQKYAEVITETEVYINDFAGDEIVSKLELLKAMAEGRLYGFEKYRESLNYVALNYPQSIEGKKAQEILNKALPSLASNQFVSDSTSNSFKLVFPFEKGEQKQVIELKEKISAALEDSNYTGGEVSLDVYDEKKDFVVVHGFSSVAGAKTFAQRLGDNKKYSVDKNYFYISTPNYRIAQIHKNIETYLTSLNTPPQ